jgi:large conductance mechanosensitive channel
VRPKEETMSFWKGFRDFLMRGNVVDLAVAVVMGVAFGAIVDSIVKDIITPLLTSIGGQPDFQKVHIGAVQIGSFLNAVISFLIKAAGVYFLIVLPFARFGAKLVVAPPPTPTETYLKEIRDLLAKKA